MSDMSLTFDERYRIADSDQCAFKRTDLILTDAGEYGPKTVSRVSKLAEEMDEKVRLSRQPTSPATPAQVAELTRYLTTWVEFHGKDSVDSALWNWIGVPFQKIQDELNQKYGNIKN